MSKAMTDAELNQHIEHALHTIAALLRDWSSSTSPTNQKRSQLLAYWLQDYTRLLRTEDQFHINSVPRLKRGSVLSVDFGYRIGREFGGRHFAVVVDNAPALSAPIVTVVPLMSLKPGYRPNQYTCHLKDGLYAPLYQKALSYSNSADALVQEATSMLQNGTALDEARAKVWGAKKMNEKAKAILGEIEHLKAGSVANTCQITTISKMRIKRPLKKDDPLYGIRLSTLDMEQINQQLESLIIWKPKKL